MTFLSEEQNRQFIGSGELNEAGQTLQEFLEEYDPRKYDNPCNTVDILVFTYAQEHGKRSLKRILLIKRRNHPCIGMWATPGGFIEFRESIDDAARRELEEETGIKNIDIEQLKSYGVYDRDPRTRVITTAYVALVPDGMIEAHAGDDAKDAEWFGIAWQSRGVKENNGISTEELQLELKCKDISVGATVVRTMYTDSILKAPDYRLIQSNGLAADHGAIIMEAVDYVKDKL